MLLTYLDFWMVTWPHPLASNPISATNGAALGKSLDLPVTEHSPLKNEGNNNTHLREFLHLMIQNEIIWVYGVWLIGRQ